MPLRPVLALLNINIHNMDIRGNPLLSVTASGGAYISLANGQQFQSLPTPRPSGHDSHFHNSDIHLLYRPIERRVEAQTRIRRKLDEACSHPGSIFGIDVAAQLATDMLFLIESKPSAYGIPLVNLAMDAHALAYIALILCLYGFDENERRKIKRTNVRRLCGLLNSVYTLLVEEAPKKDIFQRMKRVFSRWRRNNKVPLMHEEILDILRDIEASKK